MHTLIFRRLHTWPDHPPRVLLWHMGLVRAWGYNAASSSSLFVLLSLWFLEKKWFVPVCWFPFSLSLKGRIFVNLICLRAHSYGKCLEFLFSQCQVCTFCSSVCFRGMKLRLISLTWLETERSHIVLFRSYSSNMYLHPVGLYYLSIVHSSFVHTTNILEIVCAWCYSDY